MAYTTNDLNVFIDYFNDYQANFGAEKTQELITYLLIAYSKSSVKADYSAILRKISSNLEIDLALSTDTPTKSCTKPAEKVTMSTKTRRRTPSKAASRRKKPRKGV
jgi:hypothetical protein